MGFIDAILDEMKPDERLLICCKSFDKACETRDERINIKKIPKMLLGKCEFGKDETKAVRGEDQPSLFGEDEK